MCLEDVSYGSLSIEESFKEEYWVELEKAPVEIVDGDRGKNYPKKNDFSESGYCLFLNTGNVTSSGFDFSSCSFINAEKEASLRKGRAKVEDVVLTTRGTIGNTAYISGTVPYPVIRINSGMVLLRANRDFLAPEFLCFFFRSRMFSKQIEALQSGSAQPQLPIRDLKKVKLPIPSVEKQKRVVEILKDRLAAVDKARAAAEAQLEAAKALPAAYLRQAFNGEL